MKFIILYGEASSADHDGLARALKIIKEKIAQYCPQDIWNADEFGLFFRQPQNWTLCSKSINGPKKEKTCIKSLECCKSKRTEKFTLMVVGKSELPRPFKGNYGRDLGIDYYFHTKL